MSAWLIVCPSGTGQVRAGDDAGVREFLLSESRFHAGPRADRSEPLRSFAPFVGGPARRAAPPWRPRTTFARLPRAPERVRPSPMARPESAAPPAQVRRERAKPSDPIAALMTDPTLRPGDVVVFPDGPKVFRGKPTMPYTVADFEDVRNSRAIPPATRTKLLAMTGIFGARRLGGAELSLASTERGPKTPAALDRQTRAEAVRVVYPHFR